MKMAVDEDVDEMFSFKHEEEIKYAHQKKKKKKKSNHV